MKHSYLVDFLLSMSLIRAAEIKIAEAKKNGLIKGPVHLGVGQEAVAVGLSKNLRDTDRIFGAHRSHSHILGVDKDLHKLFAEVLGRKTGFSAGMGGSMHLASKSKGFLGSVPIVTGTVPLALGAGLASKLQKSGDIAISYLGDGATEEGVFHESLNFARISNIPILFVVENNLFSSHMHISLRQPSNTINRFAKAHKIKTKLIDGNDVLEVYRNSSEVIRKMRIKPEPYLIEAITYRWFGHVDWRDDIDVGVARSKEDLLNWKKRDPIKRLKDAMMDKKIWTQENQLTLDSKVEELIEESWGKAIKDDFPHRNSLLDNVYKDD
tara:strand:+ start:13395 stop:14366 length:972 start_codon:yes stop_codon:yes gene_type:complete